MQESKLWVQSYKQTTIKSRGLLDVVDVNIIVILVLLLFLLVGVVGGGLLGRLGGGLFDPETRKTR